MHAEDLLNSLIENTSISMPIKFAIGITRENKFVVFWCITSEGFEPNDAAVATIIEHSVNLDLIDSHCYYDASIGIPNTLDIIELVKK